MSSCACDGTEEVDIDGARHAVGSINEFREDKGSRLGRSGHQRDSNDDEKSDHHIQNGGENIDVALWGAGKGGKSTIMSQGFLWEPTRRDFCYDCKMDRN